MLKNSFRLKKKEIKKEIKLFRFPHLFSPHHKLKSVLGETIFFFLSSGDKEFIVFARHDACRLTVEKNCL